MTVETLQACNKKVLAQMAKDRGVIGWHSMRKDQLIRALAPPESSARRGVAPVAVAVAVVERPRPAGRKPTVPLGSNPQAVVPVPPRALAEIATRRTLEHACGRDRIVLMVRDPYWLHVHWELTRSTFARAQAALGQEWHTSRPILRVADVTSEDTTSASEGHVRDIEIHGGVTNWYIDVTRPQRSYRVDVGYLSRRGKFYVLAKSNVVTTPRVGAAEVIDQSWKGLPDAPKGAARTPVTPADVDASLDAQLGRPLNSLPRPLFAFGGIPSLGGRPFHFHIDAELVVFGTTEPNALVTLQGEHVPVRPDGTFTVRFGLPDSRQIIPAVAASADGVEERTIVLAIERNTKELEPMIHDGNDL